MSLRYADLLYLWLCDHSLLDQGVRGLLACPSPSSLLWFCKSRWVLFSPMVHTLRDGVTPAGSRIVVLDRNEGLVGLLLCATYGSRWCYALSPSGWASNLCLRLLFVPCHYRFVSWWSSLRTRVSSVVLSSLQCSSLSHVVVACPPPRHLLPVSGFPWCRSLDPSGWGWRLLFVPCSRLHFISWWSSL